mmetsp:Transcript_43085/g.111645  ORF Transcript_43085/g.111645 Transcript_43085/m.111645 type:complete len:212 (+) Transcript_43085:3005-3640(+)
MPRRDRPHSFQSFHPLSCSHLPFYLIHCSLQQARSPCPLQLYPFRAGHHLSSLCSSLLLHYQRTSRDQICSHSVARCSAAQPTFDILLQAFLRPSCCPSPRLSCHVGGHAPCSLLLLQLHCRSYPHYFSHMCRFGPRYALCLLPHYSSSQSQLPMGVPSGRHQGHMYRFPRKNGDPALVHFSPYRWFLLLRALLHFFCYQFFRLLIAELGQ